MRTSLTQVIKEFDCDYCGKHVTHFGSMGSYLFKSGSRQGTLYFCSDSCKRNYKKDSMKNYKKRRWGIEDEQES